MPLKTGSYSEENCSHYRNGECFLLASGDLTREREEKFREEGKIKKCTMGKFTKLDYILAFENSFSL